MNVFICKDFLSRDKLKFYLFGLSIFFLISSSFSQNKLHIDERENMGSATASKPIIDSDAVKMWPSISKEIAISNNGRYFTYSIENQPVHSRTLTIRSTFNSWSKQFEGVSKGFFTADNEMFIFQRSDSLFFLNLGSDTLKFVGSVNTYNYATAIKKGELLIYTFKSKELVVSNLISKKTQRFNNVVGYIVSDDLNRMLLKSVNLDSSKTTSLLLYDLNSGDTATLWSTSNINISKDNLIGFAIDRAGNHIAAILQGIGGDYKNRLRNYTIESINSKIRYKEHLLELDSNLKLLPGRIKFSKNGKYLYIQLNEKEAPVIAGNPVGVDVWSYKDEMLQPGQLNSLGQNMYLSTVDLESGKQLQITKEFEVVKKESEDGEYLIIEYSKSSWRWSDDFWNFKPSDYYLFCLNDGSKKRFNLKGNAEFWFSPNGRYLVYYDSNEWGSYYSYDLVTGKGVNLTCKLSRLMFTVENIYNREQSTNKRLKAKSPVNTGVVGWSISEPTVWVYDNYDIWQFDLTGKDAPYNITNGFGRVHNVKFRKINDYNTPIYYRRNEPVVLTAYNISNKQNGFYKVIPGIKSRPEKLTMGDWTYYHRGFEMGSELQEDLPPLKAKDTNVWVVQRHNVSQSPNFYLTTDFRLFAPLTNLNPEKNYNWLSSQLISWKQLDGSFTQGILYKPENFDPKKKYPVIFNYYHQLTHRLNEFPKPDFSECPDVNIPWFVSRGYLVCTPDIYYDSGLLCKGAYNTIISAANFISGLPFVNKEKMAIAGHSLGGHETNYLVTHTNRFAACLSGAGVCNVISDGLQVVPDGRNDLQSMEGRMGGFTLWDRPDLYIDGSAVFNANKVVTPVLIFLNKGDGHWNQRLEFFVALRRLNKKSWMLQYDKGDHGLTDYREKIDFTIRITQFFDHYLKEMPAPKWLTQGVPAKLKGRETGLSLDFNGSCGLDCTICKFWNTKGKKSENVYAR